MGELAATLQLSTVKGHEAANALAILELFDNWAQELCPSYDPEDFFDKVEKMGKTRIVRVRSFLRPQCIMFRHFTFVDVHLILECLLYCLLQEVLNDLLGITATDIERRKRRKKDDAEGTASKDNSNEAEPIVASSSEVGNSSVNLEHFTSSLNSDYIEPPDVRGAASQAVQV